MAAPRERVLHAGQRRRRGRGAKRLQWHRDHDRLLRDRDSADVRHDGWTLVRDERREHDLAGQRGGGADRAVRRTGDTDSVVQAPDSGPRPAVVRNTHGAYGQCTLWYNRRHILQ